MEDQLKLMSQLQGNQEKEELQAEVALEAVEVPPEVEEEDSKAVVLEAEPQMYN